jgi:F-box domain
MSERTISPGMDHTNSLHERVIMDNDPVPRASPHTRPAKRKWSPDHSDSSTATLISQHETLPGTETVSPLDRDSPQASKRAKMEEPMLAKQSSDAAERSKPLDRSQLPAEMWQYIFTYLPPYSLGHLMCVNRIFHNLLAPGGTLPAPQLTGQGPLGLMEPDLLWSLSRRAFFPGMPRPLFSRSELDTWKLIRSNVCESCGKRNVSTVPPVSKSPWAAGPGNDYVRIIWPFAVRSCGNCLQAPLQKVGLWALGCATNL